MIPYDRKSVICLQHKLRTIRKAVELTVQELSELSGIAACTIYRIERGDDTYKINDDTAKALADALYKQTLDIFSAAELSPLGRPPATGKSLTIVQQRRRPICPNCHLIVPATGRCDDCGWCDEERLTA